MLKFRVRNVMPPGGKYFYEVPETKAYFDGFVMDALLETIREHYAANRLDAPAELAALVEDFVCRHVPEGFCFGESDQPRAHVATYWQIKNRTKKATEAGLVPGRVAERRAGVCVGCPLNSHAICPTCTGIRDWARQLVEYRSTFEDLKLGTCEATALYLPAVVHAAEAGVASFVAIEKPANCWIGGAK